MIALAAETYGSVVHLRERVSDLEETLSLNNEIVHSMILDKV
jgi:hypothetical protein